jgi:hypothetical protein
MCFKCGDKYSPTQTYKSHESTLHVMDQVTSDGGEFLSDEVLELLLKPQLHLIQDDCYLSLNALSGKPQHKATQLRALVKNRIVVILVDSSSFHTFLNFGNCLEALGYSNSIAPHVSKSS